MKKKNPVVIIQDTREQKPLDFSRFQDVEVEVGTCWPGDYTIKGWEKSIAFERKSVSDLIGTMKDGYAGKESIRRYENRFDLELEEFERHFDRAFIIIEPDDDSTIHQVARIRHVQLEGYDLPAGEQIYRGLYRSAIPPYVIFAFIRSLTVKYGCHVYLADSRDDAAAEIVNISKMYIDSRRHIIHRGKVAEEEKRREAEAARQKPEDPF